MFHFLLSWLPIRVGQVLLSLLLILGISGQPGWAQAPTWQTAVAADQTGASFLFDMKPGSADGEFFVLGYFVGTVTLGTTTLTSMGGLDVFVAKWSALNNTYVWAQRCGGAGNEYALKLAVNGPNIYVAGTFDSSTADFGTTILTNADASGKTQDIFVVKLMDSGATGTFTWAKRAGGALNDQARAITVNGSAIYIGGGFASPTLTFGPASLTTGHSDMFVAKLVDAGSNAAFVWAQQGGGLGYDKAVYTMAVNGTDVYLAGEFRDTDGFGPTTLTSAGATDVFVAKLTDTGTSGNLVWAQRAGGGSDDYVQGMAVNGKSIYIAGNFFAATADFGSSILTNAGAGYTDVFVAKLTDVGSTGSFTWAQQAGGRTNDGVAAIAVNGTSVYVAGSFNPAMSVFGATTLLNAETSDFTTDIFVAKLTDSGSTSTFTWAQRAGGTKNDGVVAMCLTGSQLYMGGTVTPPASFSNLLLAGPGTAPVPYFASLSDNTTLATAVPLPGTDLTLYPNPAHASTTVQLAGAADALQATLTLRDALGRLVRTTTVALPTSLPYELSLVGLPSGVYSLQVQAGTKTTVRRLIVY